MRESSVNDALNRVLQAGERLLGLSLCFHARPYRRHWPNRWIIHANPACMSVKANHEPACYAHCSQQVFQVCQPGHGVVRDRCPFGHTQLLCSIDSMGWQVGLLYAGPLWVEPGRPPREHLTVPPNEQWLTDREAMLPGVAMQIAQLISEQRSAEASRRTKVLRYCCDCLDRPVSVQEVAHLLGLSCSRTRQVIATEFGCSLLRLHRRLRLEEASHRLRVTQLPIAQLAIEFGFHDQSHFTRLFWRHFGQTPAAYRAATSQP